LEKLSPGNDVERLDLSKKTVAEVVAELARHYESLRAEPAMDRLDTSFGAAPQNEFVNQPAVPSPSSMPPSSSVPPLRDTFEQPADPAERGSPISAAPSFAADTGAGDDLDRRHEPVLQRVAARPAATQSQPGLHAAWTAGNENGDVEGHSALFPPPVRDLAKAPRAVKRAPAFGWGLLTGILLTLLLVGGTLSILRDPIAAARWPVLQQLQSALRLPPMAMPPAAPDASKQPLAPAQSVGTPAASIPAAAAPQASSPTSSPAAAPAPGQPETLILPATPPTPAAAAPTTVPAPAAVAPVPVTPAPVTPSSVSPAVTPPAPAPQPTGTNTGTGSTKTSATTTKKSTTKTATSKATKTQTAKAQAAKSKPVAPVMATNKKPSGDVPAGDSQAPWMKSKPFNPDDIANFPTAAGAPAAPSATSPAAAPDPANATATGQPIPLTPTQ
jgi:hypothetical protein